MNDDLETNLLGKFVFLGKVDRVKELIDSGIDLDQIGSNGLTPLITAIEGDQPQILELFLKHGANPNQQSGVDGLTALHWAVDYAIDGMIQSNKSEPFSEPLECIKILLEYGADASIKNDFDKTVFDYPITKEIRNQLEAK